MPRSPKVDCTPSSSLRTAARPPRTSSWSPSSTGLRAGRRLASIRVRHLLLLLLLKQVHRMRRGAWGTWRDCLAASGLTRSMLLYKKKKREEGRKDPFHFVYGIRFLKGTGHPLFSKEISTEFYEKTGIFYLFIRNVFKNREGFFQKIIRACFNFIFFPSLASTYLLTSAPPS